MRPRLRLLALTTALLAATLTALALSATPAAAKPPPKGTYVCDFRGGGSAGLLKIVNGKRYVYGRSGKGTFKSKGKKIIFDGKVKRAWKLSRWGRPSGTGAFIFLFDSASTPSNFDASCRRRAPGS